MPFKIPTNTVWPIVIPDASLGAAGVMTSALVTQMKYTLALAGRIHMRADDDLVTSVPLSGAATLAQACTYAEGLKLSQIQHYDDVGTVAVDGSHLAPDPVNKAALQAIPPLTGTSLPALCSLITALDTARQNHATATDIGGPIDPTTGAVFTSHFHTDQLENDASITFAPPTTLPQAITDLNDLRNIFILHFARASAP